MGFYYRKSVNLGPFRVNLSKSGVGYSVGGRGFRVGTTSRGRKYTSFSIPGTGIGYRKSGAGCLVLLAAIPATLAISRWFFPA
jgi:hypothetical protein